MYTFLWKTNSEPLLHSGRPLNGVKWINTRLFVDDLCALGAELQRLPTLVSSEQHQGGSFSFDSGVLQGKPGASSTRIVFPSQKSDTNCSGTRICRLLTSRRACNFEVVSFRSVAIIGKKIFARSASDVSSLSASRPLSELHTTQPVLEQVFPQSASLQRRPRQSEYFSRTPSQST